jgi:peroxiredoxin
MSSFARALPIAFLLSVVVLSAQTQKPCLTAEETSIAEEMRGLRKVPDDQRPDVTKRLALAIRKLPSRNVKSALAGNLANLATEGDPGHGTLQEVATTLAQALAEEAAANASGYMTLAQLVRYEHVQVSTQVSTADPQFQAAMSTLEAADRQRENVNFTLTDLQGKSWALKDLRGQTVLVNFWATWCPPCRKEMPDMEALYQEFKGQGLVILAISDEEIGKVNPFIAEHKFSYPILLDPGRKVNELFQVEGIPKSFLYDRNGHLAAQAMDMRTRGQFLEMLAQAGIK